MQNFTAELVDATNHRKNLVKMADLLVLDMPCSGLGTLRRKADIKLRKQAGDMQALAQISREIIEASWQYVKPGGKMLFSTCTISKSENLDNFSWILDNLPFDAVDFSANLPDFLNYPTAKNGYMQILPQDFGGDGFFVGVLQRRVENG